MRGYPMAPMIRPWPPHRLPALSTSTGFTKPRGVFQAIVELELKATTGSLPAVGLRVRVASSRVVLGPAFLSSAFEDLLWRLERDAEVASSWQERFTTCSWSMKLIFRITINKGE